MRLSSRPAITLAGFALLLSAVAIPAQAASTLTVTGTGEPAALTTNDCSGTQCVTLRGAINAAASGDTIVFDKAALDGQTILLTLFSNNLALFSTQFGPSAFFLTNGKSLTIDATANGLTQGVVLARSGAAGIGTFRLFDIANGSTLSLRGLTLHNGLAQGGSSNFGGGALGAGGAIFNQGTLELQRCTLAGNVAQGGQGHAAGSTGGGGVGQTAISTNGGGPNGGTQGGSSADGGDGFPGNPGGFGGGGGQGGHGTGGSGGNGGSGGFGGGGGKGGGGAGSLPPVQSGSGGGGGFGAGGGGGGFDSGIPGLGGNGGYGGGDGGAIIAGGGGGAGMGGAIFNDAGTVTLTNVTLAENRVLGGSGYTSGLGLGGAIFNYAGFLTLSFVTASDNLAGGDGGSTQGGAIVSRSDGACGAGGNICWTGGTATLSISNTIVANSTDTTADIIPQTSVYTPSPTTLTGTLALGTLPSPLHGGLVDVMIPPAGSPSFDAGGAGPCAASTDQRGIPRPQGTACDIGAVENETIFSNDFEAVVFQPLVQCSGMTKHTDILAESFAGPALSADWTQNSNGGTVTVSDGVSLASSVTTFPFITSALPIIPAAGDFSVRWTAMYTNFANQGTGTLVLSNGLPANAASDNVALRSADAWQDSGGFRVRARTDAATYNNVFTEIPAQDKPHDVEYCWIGSQNMIEVWVDGTRQLQAPNTGLTRPTSLWFGNPVVAGGSSWSNFALDHVDVRSVSP